MRYLEQCDQKLHELNELVRKADAITTTFAEMEPKRAEESLGELAAFNQSLEFSIEEFKKFRERMSVQIIDGGKLFRDDYDAVLNLVCPDPASAKRIDAEKNGLSAIFLEPFVIDEQCVHEVTIKRNLLRPANLNEIGKLRSLRQLTIMTPDSYSFQPLAGHPKLESLTLINNPGSYNYSELQAIPNLSSLRISNCTLSIKDTEDIFQKLTGITRLEFGPESVPTLRGISGLQRLTHLAITGNEVQSLIELPQLPVLSSVSLSNVGCPDLTPLLSCKALTEVKIRVADFQKSLPQRLLLGGVDNGAIVKKLVAKGVVVR